MPYEVLETKIKSLPAQAFNEVAHYVDYILMVYSSQIESIRHNESNSEQTVIRQPGLLRGKIKIADDFDEPLEDFKEYM